jgi:nucleotide-binding universal stress UspA family protein
MITSAKNLPVVVGVDGSGHAERALMWAAGEAAARHVPLRLVCVEAWPLLGPAAMAAGAVPVIHDPDQQAGTVFERSTAMVLQQYDVPISTRAELGGIVDVLIDESERASMVVVGSRGHGGFTGLLLGSVSRHLATHAKSPVAVIGHTGQFGGPVVVGVDESCVDDDGVLRLAFEQAARRGAALIAVHAWAPPVAPRIARSNWPAFIEAARDSAAQLLAAALEPWITRFPQVKVESRLVEQAPATGLVEAADGAQLLVVGTHARGSIRATFLGSVAQVVLQHAPCPVLIQRTGTPVPTKPV